MGAKAKRREIDPAAFARLPVWAQKEIARLRLNVQDAVGLLNAQGALPRDDVPASARLIVRPSSDYPVVVDARDVELRVGKATVRVQIVADKYIHVNCSEKLAIRPYASNTFDMEPLP